jgi:chromosome segregation ATPase
LARAMLTRQLIIKEKRLGDVRQKLKQSQFACEELSSQREEARHELVMAQENLADIQLRVQGQTRERQRVVVEAIRETQGLLDVVQSEKVELAAQFRKVNREVQELMTRNFGLLSANTKLDVEVKEAEKAIQAGLEENKCLSAEIAITSDALQVSQMELHDSRRTNTAPEGRLEAAVAEVAELHAQLTKVEARESRPPYKRLRHWMSKAKNIISNWFSRCYRSNGNDIESISLRRQSFQLLH